MALSDTSLFNHANLVAYFKLDTGNLTVDSKGSYTLTNQGSIAEVSGKFGTGGDPGDPNSDNGTMYRTASVPSLTGNFSVSGWFKWQKSGANEPLFGWCDTSNDVFIRLNYDGANLLFYRVKSGVAQQGPGYAFTPTLGVWYHIVMTYDGADVRGYVNASLVGGPTSASGSGSVNETSGIGLGIDGQAFGVLTTTSTIMWDDVALFTEAITSTQISTIYNGSSASISPSASQSPSASTSPSASLSPSASASSSTSASASKSLSPSASLSPSSSASKSLSPSSSQSSSASSSRSLSGSPSASLSPSPSTSPSASQSPSQSPSRSVSPSLSPSTSQSPSASVSASPSPASYVNK